MKKRLFFLSAFMLFTSLGFAQFSGSGSGTEADPYQVRTADDLFDVRNNLNAHYKQVADIDLGTWIEEESPTSGWNPIGSNSSVFSGVYDGGGYSITGLYINKPNVDNVGLFGFAMDASFKNIVLKSVYVHGRSHVGGLVGYGQRITSKNITIQNAELSGNSCVGSYTGYTFNNNDSNVPPFLDGAKIEDIVISGCSEIGGVIGQAGASNQFVVLQNISACNISITATSDNIGGIIGITDQCVQVVNAMIVTPKISGKNNIGGTGGYLTNTEHCVVINPILTGENNVGGVAGSWISPTLNETNKTYTFSITHNIVIGGQIIGNDYVGGIIGRNSGFHITYDSNKYKYKVVGNYSSSSINGLNYVGGICGYIEGSIWKLSNITDYYAPIFQNNRSDCDIIGNEHVGGVIGYWASTNIKINGSTVSGKGMAYIDNNIVQGNVCGNQYVGGIISTRDNTFDQWSCSKNLFAANMLSSSLDVPYRIFQYATTYDNYALSTTEITSNNHIIEVEDGNGNGLAYGLRMLKRKNTYIGFGYDFERDWAIVEGETLPYNINQSTPPTISSCVCGVNAKISGTASGNGTVYVFVNDKMIEGSVVNGKWQVDLGDVAEGTKVRVSVETEGKKPSIVISTKAEYTGVDVVLDENSTEVPASASNVDVQVLRTIKADEWSTICLPFTATGEQVKQAWGEDVQLASFTGWESEEDENGAIVAINVMFSSANPADGIPANTPMLIKVSEAAETATFDGVTIEPEDEPVVQVGRKASERGWFYGTYKKTIVPEENMFLNGNKFWYSTGKTAIKGYRGYFEFRDVLDAYYDSSEVKVYMFIDEDATGIKAIDHSSLRSGGTPLTIHHYYNLAGQRVAGNYKGIVIENGKKILK